MALVVFLRGVNVGGHKAFQPSIIARQLAELDVVNVGAAGTFVVRKARSQKALRAELLRRLPVEAEVMICPGRTLIALAEGDVYATEPAAEGVERCVSVLAMRPRALPAFPLTHPAGDDWQVKIVRVLGRFALSLRRRVGPRAAYPNEVVESKLGVSATTRNWNTVSTVCRLLQRGDGEGEAAR
jgi:uncharacterized protein (DUF1697 family)